MTEFRRKALYRNHRLARQLADAEAKRRCLNYGIAALLRVSPTKTRLYFGQDKRKKTGTAARKNEPSMPKK
jgi:hypothetical protein